MAEITPKDKEKDELLKNLHGENTNNGAITPEENNGPANERGMDFEEAVSQSGCGCFNIILLALCGWAVSSDAIEVLSISFILPAAACDLQLDDTYDGVLTSVVFGGMMIGGYAWGILADRYGRRKVLICSLFFGSLTSGFSTLSQVKVEFIFWSFWAGIGSGGSLPVVFTYFAEFQPRNRRGTMVCLLAAFWMCGNIFAAGLAWGLITHSIGFWSEDFTYDSWRVYMAICALPAFTSAIAFIFLPESPKYLISVGRAEEALRVIQMMFRRNHTCIGRGHVECPVKKIHVEPQDISPAETKKAMGCCAWCTNCLCTIFDGFKLMGIVTVKLFRKPFTRATLVLTFINFTLSYGYYGLYTWFPQLFMQLALHPGPVCEIPSPTGMGSNATDVTIDCNSKIPTETYLFAFLTAVCLFPGNIFSAVAIERVGRKPLVVGSMTISGLSVFFITMVSNTWTCVAMSCVFGGILVITFGALDVLTLELFPTHLRSAVFGFQLGIGKLAGIAATLTFAELVATNCYIPMFAVAILMTAGGLSVIALPKPTQTDL